MINCPTCSFFFLLSILKLSGWLSWEMCGHLYKHRKWIILGFGGWLWLNEIVKTCRFLPLPPPFLTLLAALSRRLSGVRPADGWDAPLRLASSCWISLNGCWTASKTCVWFTILYSHTALFLLHTICAFSTPLKMWTLPLSLLGELWILVSKLEGGCPISCIPFFRLAPLCFQVQLFLL